MTTMKVQNGSKSPKLPSRHPSCAQPHSQCSVLYILTFIFFPEGYMNGIVQCVILGPLIFKDIFIVVKYA